MKKKSIMRKEWPGLMLIAPAYLLLGFTILYPTLQALWMSFHRIILTRPALGRPFIGLENYRDVVTSPHFFHSIRISVIWTGTNLGVQIVLGTLVALLIHQEFRGRSLVRGVSLIPWITPSVVAYLTWKWMYDGQFGIINSILLQLGVIERSIVWLGNMNTAMGAVIFASIWKGTPFVVLMVLASLQSIPEDLYDAAKVDGAGMFDRFRHVTLPQILPTVIIAATLTTIFTFNNFNAIWLLTTGGPLRATEVLTIYVYRQAFHSFNLGTATAAGIIIFIILYMFVMIFGRYYIKAQARKS